ncbi:MAG: hypothetical protein IKL07_07710 [Clostridium sp.]|nr:hypothetical protein [Clostridium sp.]
MENAIAIVGMDCKFPGANNLEEYWEVLKKGECVVKDALNLEEDEQYVNKAFYLDGIDEFDASFFNINNRDAKYMDPQQRLFLESAWKAFENAGYQVDQIEEKVGVFAGSGISTYLMCNVIPNMIKNGKDISKIMAQIIHGNSNDYLSSRISFNMNLDGPSLTVQTACSSALTAVHLACRSLLMYECDMALCGGVSVNSNQGQGYRYVKGEIYSKSGYCSPFSEKADGTIFSGGVGTLVLKRYEDAVEDNDFIYAVIRGSAINNDGADKMSYTAPSENGQFHVILDALAFADVDPATISYLETHGTGTNIGDQIEIAALKKVFEDGNQEVKIGSVKGNIGHAIAASGIAGLIKTILCINKGYICPSIHCEKENPALNLDESVLRIAKSYEKWDCKEQPMRAGVSSFGMGGSNAHVVLEAYENTKMEPMDTSNYVKMLKLSAKTEKSLKAMKKELYDYLKEHDVDERILINTYNNARKEFSLRSLIYYVDKEELLYKLSHDTWEMNEDSKERLESIDNRQALYELGNRLLTSCEGMSAFNVCDQIKNYWEKGEETEVLELPGMDEVKKQPLPGYVFDHVSFWIGENETIALHGGQKEEDTSSIEDYMKKLWMQYLEVEESELDKDFYELGGSSIVAYQMLADIEEKYHVELEIDEILDEPTVEVMCKMVRQLLATV